MDCGWVVCGPGNRDCLRVVVSDDFLFREPFGDRSGTGKLGKRENASWKARDGTKLPNGERAIVDSRKLQAYCLNPQHPRGRNKARVFASAGIRQIDADELRTALLAAAASAEAQTGIANPYGQRYIIDFELVRENKIVKIRSTWIVRIGEDMPRLTSCYVL
jgi:hypothetical protein